MLIACRDKTKGTTAVRDIRTTTGNDDVHLYIMDLASLESVRQCAKEVLREETRLDILINNAGMFVIVLMSSLIKMHGYLKSRKWGQLMSVSISIRIVCAFPFHCPLIFNCLQAKSYHHPKPLLASTHQGKPVF